MSKFWVAGATGFLGSFLLQQLLEQLPVTTIVYCHVRAADEAEAVKRVQHTLTTCMIWRDEYRARIVGVPGDLGKTRLGLKEEQWNTLADRIDAIVHNGAYVHWLLPYAKLRPSNVEATIEVLRLACTKRGVIPGLPQRAQADALFEKAKSTIWKDDK